MSLGQAILILKNLEKEYKDYIEYMKLHFTDAVHCIPREENIQAGIKLARKALEKVAKETKKPD